MNQSLTDHLTKLKNALLTLDATGEQGFEGLLAVMLYEITGVPFRLAASGLQGGVDGMSAFDNDAICFEGKLYKGKLPRTEIIPKIADLARNNSYSELVWVLGSTTAVSTQHAKDVKTDGFKDGIIVLILDWSETQFPLLAVALAMGGQGVEDFLSSKLNDINFNNTTSALKAIKDDKNFKNLAAKITAELDGSATAIAFARKANTEWMMDGFTNRKNARLKFKQPLAPSDTSAFKVLPRNTLTEQLKAYLLNTSENKIAFVLGGEGYGKSWIVAQSWLQLDPKPLLILFTSDELSDAAQIDEVLIAKIIKQTDDKYTDANVKRWERRFVYWQQHTDSANPQIIVFLDGINQKSKENWGRIIDELGYRLQQLGGRLVVTVRTTYFETYVKNRVSSEIVKIDVPEWLPSERDEILNSHGFAPHKIHVDVAKSLLNPRLLGIALELLRQDELITLEELSISRLLFEHIRKSEQDSLKLQPAAEFVLTLTLHAKKIIERIQQNQEDDLKIFESETLAVADGRFFYSVECDPSKYQLIEDGLTFALGFAIIDRLRVAKRNNRNLDDSLAKILEPITALDATPNVVHSALTVTVIDEQQYMPEIAAALIKGFASLQNPDEYKYPAFMGLMKRKPLPFMHAAYDLCLEDTHQPNFDWVKFAVIESSKADRVWKEIESEIRKWLSFYSLSSELGMLPNQKQGTPENIAAEKQKISQEIDAKLSSLSNNESIILNRLIRKDCDFSRLHRLALMTLAGKPLCSHVECFINWSFSVRLNFTWGASNYEEFNNLISFNRIDWIETRAELLHACELLFNNDASISGKWALVTILRATGDSNDDEKANLLVAELTKTSQNYSGWRSVEDYCATDPCKPDSSEPDNISSTAEKYMAIDVSTLNRMMGTTSEDSYFSDARLGMARFKLNKAVQKHLEFAENILIRNDLPLRQGIFELRKHEVLLQKTFAVALVNRWKAAKTNGMFKETSEKNQSIISQYLLFLIFPLLSATEQFDIYLSIKDPDSILLDLLGRTHVLDSIKFEQLVLEAFDPCDERKLFLLLLLAHRTNIQLSQKAHKLIRSLININSDRLQTELWGIAAKGNDHDLLLLFVNTAWCADNVKNKRRGAVCFGSIAMLRAAQHNLIEHTAVLDRISPNTYGLAAQFLNLEAKQEIGRRIDACIKKMLGIEEKLLTPDINVDLNMPSDNSDQPSGFKTNQKAACLEKAEVLPMPNQTIESFQEQQKRNHQVFYEFKRTLSRPKASIILDCFSLQEFVLIVLANEQLADEWFQVFINFPATHMSFMHNLILLLANAFSANQPAKALALFNKAKNSHPSIRFTFGSAGMELSSLAVWAAEHSSLDDERTYRLDSAVTDYELSLEVLAALESKQQLFLEQYIDKKLEREEPAEIARGLMVAGFSDASEVNANIIKRYENTAGMIGKAYKAAKYAYERNEWARHWYQKMCETNQRNEFWQASLLLNKIVDGRFEVWHQEYERQGQLIATYGPTSERLKNRYDRWKTHREKTLFGNQVPDSIFLQ